MNGTFSHVNRTQTTPNQNSRILKNSASQALGSPHQVSKRPSKLGIAGASILASGYGMNSKEMPLPMIDNKLPITTETLSMHNEENNLINSTVTSAIKLENSKSPGDSTPYEDNTTSPPKATGMKNSPKTL